MARSISAKVGRNGQNRYQDVVTIQKLLNEIDPRLGGAKPKLAVDGKCGRKTKAAIQAFQLNQFGWKFADGRVDPGGPTLQRMNECVGGVASWKKSSTFQMRRLYPDMVPSRPGILELFEMHDVQNHRRAFSGFVSDKTVRIPASVVPVGFRGSWCSIKAAVPLSIREVEGPATLATKVKPGPPESGIYEIYSTTLTVRCRPGTVSGLVSFVCSSREQGYFKLVGNFIGVT